jgi:hypothetical protein
MSSCRHSPLGHAYISAVLAQACDAVERAHFDADTHSLRCMNVRLLHWSSRQFRRYKVIYRRYAGLYFSFCLDMNDNELMYLESIHLFVELLDKFFASVCELDVRARDDTRRETEELRESEYALFSARLYSCACCHCRRLPSCAHTASVCSLTCAASVLVVQLVFNFHKIYSILDEIYLAGEVQETSKRVILERLEELSKLE